MIPFQNLIYVQMYYKFLDMQLYTFFAVNVKLTETVSIIENFGKEKKDKRLQLNQNEMNLTI